MQRSYYHLSAQAFLFPDTTDTEEAELLLNSQIQGHIPLEFNNVQTKEWRKKGCLGKLHNIAVAIQRSNQRQDAFLHESGGLRITRDNATRWNSWYRLIFRAILLKRPIQIFCFKNLDWLGEDTLTDEDWRQLELLKTFLEKFSDATLACESRFATIESILPIMEFLLDTLEVGKETYVADAFLGPCCKAGWEKLDKYYSLTEESPAYAAAIILCPTEKLTAFNKWAWPEAWVEKARKMVLNLWETEYKGHTSPIEESSQAVQASDKRENSFWAWQKSLAVVLEVGDEYAQYLASPILRLNPAELKTFNPRAWWLEPSQSRLYPNLSRMALDLLSIPAMSAEVERLFSNCKITITDRRASLGIESVEAIECLKSW